MKSKKKRQKNREIVTVFDEKEPITETTEAKREKEILFLLNNEKQKWFSDGWFKSNTTGLCVYEDLLFVSVEHTGTILPISINDGKPLDSTMINFCPPIVDKGSDLIDCLLSKDKKRFFLLYRCFKKLRMYDIKRNPITKILTLTLLSEIDAKTPWSISQVCEDVYVVTSETTKALFFYSIKNDELSEICDFPLQKDATGIAVDRHQNIYYTSRMGNFVFFMEKNQITNVDSKNFGFSIKNYETPIIIAGSGSGKPQLGQTLNGDKVQFNTLHSICVSSNDEIFICQSGTENYGMLSESFILKIKKKKSSLKEHASSYEVSPAFLINNEDRSALGLCLDSRNNLYYSTYSTRGAGRVSLYNISEELILFYNGFYDENSTIRFLLKEIIFIVGYLSVFHT